jgi:hypothetical protein
MKGSDRMERDIQMVDHFHIAVEASVGKHARSQTN